MYNKELVEEMIVREIDNNSKSQIIQLTSSCVISHNIYGEQPANSPDGTKLVFVRKNTTNWHDPCEYWLADLQLGIVRKIAVADSAGTYLS